MASPPPYPVPTERVARGASGRPILPALASMAIVVAALHFADEVLIPLALAGLLSFLLAPLVERLEKWKAGRVPAVVAVVLLAFTILGGIGWLAVYQLKDLIEKLPSHTVNIEKRLRDLRRSLPLPGEAVNQVLRRAGEAMNAPTVADSSSSEEGISSTTKPAQGTEDDQKKKDATKDGPTPSSPWLLSSEGRPIFVRVVEGPPALFKQLISGLAPFLDPLGKAGIVTVLAIFILLKREDLRNRVIRLAGNGRLSGPTQAMNDAANRISRYLLMQSSINGGFGILVGVGLYFLGVESWALWGFLCGALRFLPYIGLWLGAIPPLLLLLVTSDDWTRPLLAMALFGGLELVTYLVVEPWFYRLSAGVSAFAILLAAVFWTWVWGPIGLLLATPLTVCLVVMGKHIPQLSFLSVLLGDEEPLHPHEQYYQRLLADDPEDATAVVEDFLKTRSKVELHDSILAPALVLAAQDWREGALSDQKRSDLFEAMENLVEAVHEDWKPPASPEVMAGMALPGDAPAAALSEARRRIVCLAAHNRADEVAAKMLSSILEEAGYASDVLSGDLLVGELIEKTAASNAEAACVVALQGAGRQHARVLSKRLRAQLPQLKTVILTWGGLTEAPPHRDARMAAAADAVVKTAAEMLERLKALGLPPLVQETEVPTEPPTTTLSETSPPPSARLVRAAT